MVRWRSYTPEGTSEGGKWNQDLHAHCQDRRVQELSLEMLPRLLLPHLGQSDHGGKSKQSSANIQVEK